MGFQDLPQELVDRIVSYIPAENRFGPRSNPNLRKLYGINRAFMNATWRIVYKSIQCCMDSGIVGRRTCLDNVRPDDLIALSKEPIAPFVKTLFLVSYANHSAPLSTDGYRELSHAVSRFQDLTRVEFSSSLTCGCPVEVAEFWMGLLQDHRFPLLDKVSANFCAPFIDLLEEALRDTSVGIGTGTTLQQNLSHLSSLTIRYCGPLDGTLLTHLCRVRELTIVRCDLRLSGSPPPNVLPFGGKLEWLHLIGVELDSKSFLRFLRPQLSSLTSLNVTDVDLTGGTWDDLLAIVANHGGPLQCLKVSHIFDRPETADASIIRHCYMLDPSLLSNRSTFSAIEPRAMEDAKNPESWPAFARLLDLVATNRKELDLAPDGKIVYTEHMHVERKV